MKANDLTRRSFVSKVSFSSFIAMAANAIPALGSVPIRPDKVEKTWLEVGGKTYGARPDKLGPIGGGEGYSGIITKGDFEVTTLDSLIDALSKAKAGQVIYIPSETEIDLLRLLVPRGI